MDDLVESPTHGVRGGVGQAEHAGGASVRHGSKFTLCFLLKWLS